MGPEALAQVLRPLQAMFQPADHPELLLGLGQPDDAAVYRLDDDRALILTTDFFTPIVDDPTAYGAIAAANALSDVYATGGRPLLALNLVAFPSDLEPDVCAAILCGAAQKVAEAGAVIAGGHSIQDAEPKFGLAVLGIAHPDEILTKSGARPGDVLVLTKPLGSGCISTAAKQQKADDEAIDEATQWMSRLNRAAANAARAAEAKGATDVTGYGLIGHGTEMTRASDVTFLMEFDRIPLYDSVRRYAEQGIFPGGSKRNRKSFESGVRFEVQLADHEQLLLFDAQTSGGLLVAVPSDRLDAFAASMAAEDDQRWWEIGRVVERDTHDIVVTG